MTQSSAAKSLAYLPNFTARKVQAVPGGLPADVPDSLAAWATRYLALAVVGVRSEEVAKKIALHLDRFVGFFIESYGHDRLSTCLWRDVLAWQRALVDQGLAPATVNNHLASLSAFTTGIKERAFGPLPLVSLEVLVPPDHFYRHLERTLDLGFVRDLVREAYAGTGRPSVDPVVFFKLQLILFFEGLRSERQLMRVVADRLSLRWYLGDDLSESLPDHSSLTRIRKRYGLDVFRRFFEAIVEQCVAAGLVWGEELYIGASKVGANAATASLRSRFAVEAHLAHFFAPEDDGDGEDRTEDPDQTDDRAPAPLPVALTPDSRCELAERAAQRHDWIGQAGRPNRNETSGSYRRTADFHVSTTDSDATPLPQPDGHIRLGYQDHYVLSAVGQRPELFAEHDARGQASAIAD